jgi:hypothetical protein
VAPCIGRARLYHVTLHHAAAGKAPHACIDCPNCCWLLVLQPKTSRVLQLNYLGMPDTFGGLVFWVSGTELWGPKFTVGMDSRA